MIMGLAHVCFIAANLDRALRFYCDTLGFKTAFDFVNAEGQRFGVYLKAGQRVFIEIFQGTVQPAGPQASFKHICLEVDDLPATVADLRGKGVEVSDPILGCDQSWQAWLSDPDGNQIELHAYTEASWQRPWLD